MVVVVCRHVGCMYRRLPSVDFFFWIAEEMHPNLLPSLDWSSKSVGTHAVWRTPCRDKLVSGGVNHSKQLEWLQRVLFLSPHSVPRTSKAGTPLHQQHYYVCTYHAYRLGSIPPLLQALAGCLQGTCSTLAVPSSRHVPCQASEQASQQQHLASILPKVLCRGR